VWGEFLNLPVELASSIPQDTVYLIFPDFAQEIVVFNAFRQDD